LRLPVGLAGTKTTIMAVIGIDIGGTKISAGLYEKGHHDVMGKVLRGGAEGDGVLHIILDLIDTLLDEAGGEVRSVGMAVPGIWNEEAGTVWAPNIPGWIDYPLRAKLQQHFRHLSFYITSDRACYILGEAWKGNAQGCLDAIFLAAGTGIAAGIMADGKVLHGSKGVAGAIGWMALNKPFDKKYKPMGCNEYYASGPGLVRYAREVLEALPQYNGMFRNKKNLTAEKLMEAYEQGDEVAVQVLGNAIEYWGMCIANLVSIFNPEKIILGGGVFQNNGYLFRDAILAEAMKWGQPLSMKQFSLECSALGDMAGVYGAISFALEKEKNHLQHE
jgi:glucokinase